MDNITDEQRKALYDAIDSIKTIRVIRRVVVNRVGDVEMALSVFWRTFAVKYFLGNASFDNALNKARNRATDCLIDNIDKEGSDE